MRKKIFTAVTVIFIIAVNGGMLDVTHGDQGQSFSTVNGPVELRFPAGWFKNEKDNPYDLQCFSKLQRMNTGVFLFSKVDLAEEFTPEKLFQLQIEDLKSKRKNFAVLENKQIIRTDQKKLTSIVYSGEKGVSRYYYRFTLVEFLKNPELFLVVLQVSIPSYWKLHKPILEEITLSARTKH